MFSKIDQAILAFCTKFSHAFQRATGLTCYFIARIGIGLVAIAVIADSINHFHQFMPHKSDLFEVAMDGIILVTCFLRSLTAQRADDRIGDGVKPADLMIYLQGWFWRLIWVGFLAIDFVTSTVGVVWKHQPFVTEFLQNVVFSLGMSIFYYFIAVDPLPPGTSKIKEWWTNLGRAMRPAYQENR